MEYSFFHFSDSMWLWGLLLIPAALAVYALCYRPAIARSRLERFADKHLLPHLVIENKSLSRNIWKSLLVWSLLWSCGIIAMAGPRWNYTDLKTFKPQENLVILLDLSKSMDAQDIKPSRIAQGREQIEDILKQANGINIGLVAYAADAHMVSPITDDTRSILDLLPYLDTSLPYVQGDNLKPALAMAARMLSAEPGNNKSILIISDGNFEDGNVAEAVGNNMAIYTLGTGTQQGTPVPALKGGWVKDESGKMLFSRLQENRLRVLAGRHHGFYERADYSDGGIHAILHSIARKEKGENATGQTVRSWEEHFYLPVLLMALLMLPLFRKGAVFPVLMVVALLALAPGQSEAADWRNAFLNKPQQAQESFNKGNYKDAASTFDTPYRRGVAQYKAGDFAAAEKSFAQAQSATPGAQYNLANAQVMEGKYDDAIASYESVLKREPSNQKAQHNLDIARKLKQQKQEEQKQASSDQQKHDEKNNAGQSKNDEPQQGGGQQKNAQGKDGQSPKDTSSAGQQKGSGQNSSENAESGKQQPASASQSKKPNPAQNDTSAGSTSKADKNSVQPKNQQSSAGQRPQGEEQKLPAPQAGQQTAQGNNTPQSQKPNATDPQQGAANDDHKAEGPIIGQEGPRTQKDVDADQWLNRVENDPQSFLKNQFRIESQADGTAKGEEP